MWLILSILTAFFFAAEGAWSKRISKSINNYTITWSMFAFGIPVCIIPLIITGIPVIKGPFFWAGGGSLIINMVACTLFIKAIKISPLSITFSFLAFTPVFLIITSYIFLGELPNIYGISGILLIAFGAYVLNMIRLKEGILVPIRAIKKEKGAVLMLIVALLWSFAAIFDKVALLASSPYFYITALNCSFLVLYMPFLLKVNPDFINEVKNNLAKLSFLGLLGGLMLIFQMTAVKIALVSYVIAIKRAGMIFTLIFGWIFFKEELSVFKIVGTLLMVAGVFLILIFN